LRTQLGYKNSRCLTGVFLSLLLGASLLPAFARVHKSISQATSSASVKSSRLRKHHKKIVHKKVSPEEIAAAREAQAREAEESRFNQSRIATLSRAYQLYDSGTNEFLLGNYKYSVLQLKLASQLLSDHNEENSALDIAALNALASSAKAAGDRQLAKSVYEKLLLMNPQDTAILLKLARLEAASGDFRAAQQNVNRVISFSADNQEALQLSNLINSSNSKNGDSN